MSKRSVFEDLGFSKKEALVLTVKTDIHSAVLRIIKKNKYTQRELSLMLNEPQPRISELLNGKIAKMSIEKLLTYVAQLGVTASVVVNERKAA